MEKAEKCIDLQDQCRSSDDNSVSSDIYPKNKSKGRGKKRKRRSSNSSTGSDVLPENASEVEKCVTASAVRNNLDEVSVKKILKKVVTNDHVLALVKLREEEEQANMEESNIWPKLTRAKVKELRRVSPKTAPWNLENLELTPIKHIPVKTRPEVKALIAQELPDDEDDEEYQPTHDDVPSDDDQGLESCSDLDSQPRTPATPRSQHRTSPKVVSDGPFKIPQGVSTPTHRKLELEEEEATIALRTRSKLSLSETPIEHIESSFVPPDDIPMLPVDDHLWNDFLNECLNPASVSRNEEDDETDPEYNVAADPDAHDEDEEALESSIIKISKKELNDLVTELFSIIPEGSVEDELTNMANSVLTTDNSHNETTSRWEGKQEPLSDEEKPSKLSDRLVFERSSTRLSIGKSEPEDPPINQEEEVAKEVVAVEEKTETETRLQIKTPSNVVDISVEEHRICIQPVREERAPPPLLRHMRPQTNTSRMQITIDKKIDILPEQILILQQQIRMHVQLATSNFLQLFVNPIHWAMAPTYKEYLETLVNMVDAYPQTVVNVCNLQPAMELVETWEKTVSQDTPENKSMVEFIQNEAERWRRRSANNNFYVGEFHETLKRVIANSPVFLYPFLLPPMPYRADNLKRYGYLGSEDELIVLGLDQFWSYVEDNPKIYKPPSRLPFKYRWGLMAAIELLHKHNFPWMPAKLIKQHIQLVRRNKVKDNPICQYFAKWQVMPVKHKLVAYNPKLTLYEQPEHEMPRIWLRYLAKTSKRFRDYLFRRTKAIGQRPKGVHVDIGLPAQAPIKDPLPITYLKEIQNAPTIKAIIPDKYDVEIDRTTKPSQVAPSNFFRLILTTSGACLVPLTLIRTDTLNTVNNIMHNKEQTTTVDSNTAPISSAVESKTHEKNEMIESNKPTIAEDPDHCTCCVLLRKMRRLKQTIITDYFGSRHEKINTCCCIDKKYPKISNRLRLLVSRYKSFKQCIYNDINNKIKLLNCTKDGESERLNDTPTTDTENIDDLAFVTAFQMKLLHRMSMARNTQKRKKIDSLMTSFDPDFDDPITLANDFEHVFETSAVDMYKEFLAFLTPEQAERMDQFRDYFTQNCVEELVRRVEEQVTDKDTKVKILCIIQKWFTGVPVTSCAMCSEVLTHLDRYPNLAEYTFSLFPHLGRKLNSTPRRKHAKNTDHVPLPTVVIPMQDQATDHELEQAADYEADHSDSGEEETKDIKPVVGPVTTQIQESVQTFEPDIITTPNLPVSQTEDDSDSSDMSMMIMSEDESIKAEPPEWRRAEDKLILEILKQHLSPEERKDKTILEIIEEKNILHLLFDSLMEKSMEDIRERVMYLLKMLLVGES